MPPHTVPPSVEGQDQEGGASGGGWGWGVGCHGKRLDESDEEEEKEMLDTVSQGRLTAAT